MPYTFSGQYENLPDWYKAIIRNSIEQSESLRQQQYPNYPGPRVATPSNFTAKSYEKARGLGAQERYYDEAARLMRPSSVPYSSQVEPYLNPFMKHVVEALGRQGTRTFNENILPALEAKFVNLGQHGSSRHRGLAERAARDVQEEILRKQQEALAQGYSEASNTNLAEKMRNLEAGRGFGNLGLHAQRGAHEDINMINALGTQQQQQNQHVLNEQQAEFWRRQMWPHQMLSQHQSVISGIPSPSLGTSTMAYTPPQAVPQLNTLGNLGGLATGLYGTLNQPRLKKGGHLGLSSLMFKKRKKRR